jgi:hypothetical protein
VVTLKVTQQGVIKKPMVRVSNMLLFGFHRSVDRFLKDLNKKIEEDKANALLEKQAMEEEDVVTSMGLEHRDVPEAETPKAAKEENFQKPAAIDESILNHKASSVLENDWDLVSEIYERKKDQ